MRAAPAGLPKELIVFTIAARNFIPYARVLHDSLRQHNPGIRFVLGLCDQRAGFNEAELGFEVIDLPGLRDMRVWGMAERYNITELCTAIKPLLFRRLMARHPGHAILYLDPDIYVTGPLQEVHDAFQAGAQVVLTPHVLEPGSRPELFPNDTPLRFGIYNLGFLGIRDTAETRRLMAWWADRLERECVIDVPRGLFVDQKWADLFPALIDRVHVLRHAGYNVAYWNVLERQVELGPDGWSANGVPLRFAHFSGHELTKPEAFSRHGWWLDRHAVGDLLLLQACWRDQVLRAGYLRYGRLRYAFRWNGVGGQNLHTPEAAASQIERDAKAIDRPLLDGDLYTQDVQDWDEYCHVAALHQPAFEAHRAAELAVLPRSTEWFTLPGTCAMCRTHAEFGTGYEYAHETAADGRLAPNWREHLTCRCGFPNRIRAAMHVLQRDIQPSADARLYVTEGVTRLFKWLKLRWPGTQGSEFLGPDHQRGALYDGVRHEDVCRLTFADQAFDAVLSFDVLEHVEDLDAALRECHRVLRPGGALLFAAPTQFGHGAVVDRVRVRADGSYEHLAEPEYHGNPVSEQGSLCFRYLGLNVLGALRRIGFAEARCMLYWSQEFGYLGSNQNLVIARKSAEDAACPR